jgi:hypothetical protein
VHKRLQLRWWTLVVVVTVLLVWFIRVWQGSTSMIPTSIIHSFLYFPDPVLVATPDELGLVYEDVYMITAGGVVVHGWYLPREEAVATLYFLHGNAGNISHRLAMLERLHRGGFNVFILHYRGYGRSEGRPSEAGTYQDALAGWRWLRPSLNSSSSFPTPTTTTPCSWRATPMKSACASLYGRSSPSPIPDVNQ